MIDDAAIARLRARLDPARAAELAARLRGGSPTGGPPAIPRRTAPGPAPLSLGQQRLWLLDQLQPGTTQYNLPLAVRIRGALDVGALTAALSELVRRHEILRTTFQLGPDGEPAQHVQSPRPVALPVQDLSALGPAAAEAEADRLVDAQVIEPLPPLGDGPLLRARLVRIGRADHALLITLHHIITDGWSHGVLVKDTLALYQAFARGQAPALPPLALQYADYAAWQRDPAGEARLAPALAFWRRQLTPPPPPLELATERLRTPRTDGAAVGHAELWPAAELDALRALAGAHHATLFMTVLAGLQALILRYTGQRELLIGTPVAHRERPELESLIGFFVNTLVLRAQPAPSQAFAALLAAVRDHALACFAHQDAPLERVVELLDRARGAPFRVFHAHQNAPMPVLHAGGLELEVLEPRARRAQFDLTLVTSEVAGGLRVELVADAHRFAGDAPARIVGHLRRLLAAAAAAPTTLLAALPVLDAAERAALLAAGTAASVVATAPVATAAFASFTSASSSDIPASGRIEHLIEAMAVRQPDAPAVTLAGRTIRYRALDQRANAIAHRLVDGGLRPEQITGVLVERSPDAIAAVLGVLKAGGAFLLLDPDHPPERLAAQLADARPQAIVTTAALAARLPRSAAVHVVLDDCAPAQPAPPRTPARRLDHLAYVLYTSGSTGAPKAVMVDHHSLAVQLAWRADALAFGPADRLFHTIPFTFDPAIWGMLGPLVAGAAIELLPAGGHRDPAAMVALIAAAGATIVDLALPALHGMLALDGSPDALDGVRFVFCGGDALDADTVDRFARRFRAAQLCNVYGPTEATIDATAHLCAPGDARAWTPIGRPVASKRVYVLDVDHALVPVGIPGELCIGGATLARGYLGRPALTAERFVPDPFAATPGARMYRTGDAARWGAGDVLEFLGRLDRQVKIRGMRIEPGEVEAALHQHPGVARAVVTAIEPVAGERALVGYFIAAGEPPSPAALRAFLRDRLPEPMIPRAFVALAAFPLGAGGKLDLRALPAPALDHRADHAAYVAPRDALEAAIARQWAALLGVDRVGVDDDFFALGGHSVVAMRAMAQLRVLVGADVPTRALFEHPTIAALVRYAAAAGLLDGAPLAASVVGIASVPAASAWTASRQVATSTDLDPSEALRSFAEVGHPSSTDANRTSLPDAQPQTTMHAALDPSEAPLSFAQDHVWQQVATDAAGTGDAALNVPLVVELHGALSRDALASAITALVRRHDALRTTFPVRDGRVVQAVAAHADVPLAYVDLRTDPAPDAAVARQLAPWAAAPFAVAHDVPLRARVLQLAADRHVLALLTHRLVYDGATAAILARDLAQLYVAALTGAPPALPAIAIQMPELARRQRARWSTAALAERRQLWEIRLGDSPAPALRPDAAMASSGTHTAVDTSAAAIPDTGAAAIPSTNVTVIPNASTAVIADVNTAALRGRALEATVSAARTAALAAVGRQHRATLFAVLLCGFEIVLHDDTGQDDFIVACPMACRDDDALASTVGRLVNLVPVRAGLWGDPDLGALIARVRDRLLDLYTDDQRLPFAALGLLDAGRDRVMFNLTTAPPRAPAAGLGLSLTLAPPAEQFATELDLALHVVDDAGELRLRLTYRADRFTEARAQRWLARYQAVLDALIERTTQPLSSLTRATPRRITATTGERVVIVGAGPAGLLLAAQLAQRGDRVEVYEAHPDPRGPAQGGVRRPTINITLCERGLVALDTIGLAPAVRRAAMPATRRIIHDATGDLVVQPYGNRGEALFSVTRLDLLRLLLQAIERLPNVRLRFGDRLIDLDPQAGELRFRTHGGGESLICADRIVGADGAQSIVRHMLQRRSRVSVAQDYAPLGYKEVVTVARARADWSRELDALHLWPRGRFMLIGLPNRQGTFSLTLHMPNTGAGSFESLATSADVLALFERTFPDVLAHTPALGSELIANAANAVVTVRCSAWTAAGKVALLGDAAHAMAPYYGQGTNAAFEDCATLVGCLDAADGQWATAIEDFARRRRPEADAMCTIALEHARELSEAVADPRFHRRKAIERKLNERFPERFRSLYQMVSFSTLAYSAALQIEDHQRRLIDSLVHGDALAADLDSGDAARVLAQAVRALPVRWPAGEPA